MATKHLRHYLCPSLLPLLPALWVWGLREFEDFRGLGEFGGFWGLGEFAVIRIKVLGELQH